MSITIDLSGEPEVQKLLSEFDTRQLNNRTRRALRAGAKPIRDEMRRRGKSRGDWPARPKSFAKTRTRGHRNPLGVSISPQSPLSNIYEKGAKGHTIAPRHSRDLVNRETGFYARGAVEHPGVSARPFIEPVFEAADDKAKAAFAAVLFEGIE